MFISQRLIKPFCATALAAFLLAPSAANAVTTPVQYCASLGSPSVELLNVQVAATTANLNLPVAVYTLHCCLNATYKVMIFYMNNLNSPDYITPILTSASCH